MIKGFQVTESFDKSTGEYRILVHDVADLSPFGFDLKGTLESGQCFRWKAAGDSRYYGIVRGKAVFVSIENKRHLLIENSTPEDFYDIWHNYFDLSTDYSPIGRKVDKDPFLHEAVTFSGGARMLRQDFEETLFSYILSAQNNIPRIKKLIESLCEKYGTPIVHPAANSCRSSFDKVDLFQEHALTDFEGGIPGYSLSVAKNGCSGYSLPDVENSFPGYAFPDASVLSRSFCTEPREFCKSGSLCSHPFAGYRCPYVRGTAQMLMNPSMIPDFTRLARCSSNEARKELCRFPGVGEKVADCVLLYSGLRTDICPVDTWVEKTIKEFYLDTKATKNEIRAFTDSYFGKNAGYAQLWFFNYVRNHPAPMKKRILVSE